MSLNTWDRCRFVSEAENCPAAAFGSVVSLITSKIEHPTQAPVVTPRILASGEAEIGRIKVRGEAG
jgi:hypothetical protein